jgi:glycosyltransferase involved in cell wall biosynthesis
MTATIMPVVREFMPEVMWVLPELEAVSVARLLRGMINIPVHATWHDAHDAIRFVCPTGFYPLYRSLVRHFLKKVDSFDAVSRRMVDHYAGLCPKVGSASYGVVRPSVDVAWMREGPLGGRFPGCMHRVGLCGSARVDRRQWRAFLRDIGKIGGNMELVIVGESAVPSWNEVLPANVRLRCHDYQPSDEALIRLLVEEGVDACYLGLWRDREHAGFSEMSLSSKLVAYAAAGLPTIVDAPRESATWELVEKYNAGVLLPDPADAAGRQKVLSSVFRDDNFRRKMGAGASRLCREEFDLDRNVQVLLSLLKRTAARGWRIADCGP